MEKLYYERPYIKSFEAGVLRCTPGKNGGFDVILDRTGFYPEGGGQPADTGRLGEAAVLSVHERGGEIIHSTDRPLAAGGKVTGELDWEKRYDNMQQHSGEHLLSGLVHKKYGYDNVGFHMGREEVTVDFNGVLTWEQAESIEAEANRLIYENLPVQESFPDRETLAAMDYRSKKELSGQVRIIEIPGGDVCACCGTHVMRTGEIGLIKIIGLINYKGGVRLSLLCGRRALEDYGRRVRQVAAISELLSAKQSGIVEAVVRLKQESEKKGARLGELYQQLLSRKAEGYQDSKAPLAVFEAGLAPVHVRQFCTLLCEGNKGSVVLVCSGEEGGYQYALGSQSLDVRPVCKAMNGRLSGRGGGSAVLAQGTFTADRESVLRAFHEVLGE